MLAIGKEGKKYDGVWFDYPIFSPDSQHLAYWAEKDNKKFVVLDGKEGKKGYYWAVNYNHISSPDRKHFAYIASEGNKSFVVLDRKEGKRYDGVSCLTFSPDSQHFAYEAKEGNKKFVVLDGKEGKRYDDIYWSEISYSTFTFSPNSQHFAYIARDKKEKKLILVLDNHEQGKYDWIWEPKFASDNQHLIYFAQKGNEIWRIVERIGE